MTKLVYVSTDGSATVLSGSNNDGNNSGGNSGEIDAYTKDEADNKFALKKFSKQFDISIDQTSDGLILNPNLLDFSDIGTNLFINEFDITFINTETDITQESNATISIYESGIKLFSFDLRPQEIQKYDIAPITQITVFGIGKIRMFITAIGEKV